MAPPGRLRHPISALALSRRSRKPFQSRGETLFTKPILRVPCVSSTDGGKPAFNAQTLWPEVQALLHSKRIADGGPVDIVHLTFRPPFASGSYNRMVGAQLRKLRQYRHVAISYWEGDPPEPADSKGSVIVVNGKGLSPWQKAYLRLPYRIRRHGFYSMENAQSLTYTWQVLKLLPRLRPKLIICYSKSWLGPIIRPAIRWPARIVFSQRGLSHYLSSGEAHQLYSLRSFDAVWTLTEASYRLDRSRISAYEPLVKVLPNFVDEERFAPPSREENMASRAGWALPSGSSVVLLLSRLVPKKGAHLILHSWPRVLREVPNAYLWIVGAGDRDYEGYLRDLVQALGIGGNVRLQGAVAPDSTVSCYQAADLYLLPTLASEGMSTALLEAMACGLPCIVSSDQSAREHYTDREVFLVPDPNLEDVFVEPIVRLLGDRALRERLGASARAAVEARYSERVMLAEIADFYRRQLSLVDQGSCGAGPTE